MYSLNKLTRNGIREYTSKRLKSGIYCIIDFSEAPTGFPFEGWAVHPLSKCRQADTGVAQSSHADGRMPTTMSMVQHYEKEMKYLGQNGLS